MINDFIIEFDMKHPEFWIFPNGAFNSATNQYEKTHGWKSGGSSKRIAQNEISKIRKNFSICEPYNFVIYDCTHCTRFIDPILVHKSKEKIL